MLIGLWRFVFFFHSVETRIFLHGVETRIFFPWCGKKIDKNGKKDPDFSPDFLEILRISQKCPETMILWSFVGSGFFLFLPAIPEKTLNNVGNYWTNTFNYQKPNNSNNSLSNNPRLKRRRNREIVKNSSANRYELSYGRCILILLTLHFRSFYNKK